jgi:hypothetical protein
MATTDEDEESCWAEDDEDPIDANKPKVTALLGVLQQNARRVIRTARDEGEDPGDAASITDAVLYAHKTVPDAQTHRPLTTTTGLAGDSDAFLARSPSDFGTGPLPFNGMSDAFLASLAY